MKNIGAVVIPARYESSRFPGKPLADINGKVMIKHVYDRCVSAVGSHRVYIATDDLRIEQVVTEFGGNVVMTSTACLTGTDRLAEANETLNCDFLVNVQGDEPMISSSSVKLVFEEMERNTSQILNCYCEIDPHEIPMSTVPKVVVSQSGRLLYMSRGGCPFDKNGTARALYKQICIYGFGRSHLEIFKNHPGKTRNEKLEDIEILRFLDLDQQVIMLEVARGGIAVDTPEDLARARLMMADGSL